MENRPITLEECIDHLSKALKSGNKEEIEHWDFLVRAENDWRREVKRRMRERKDENLRSRLKEAYRLK